MIIKETLVNEQTTFGIFKSDTLHTLNNYNNCIITYYAYNKFDNNGNTTSINNFYLPNTNNTKYTELYNKII